jgi:hypothetical protein
MEEIVGELKQLLGKYKFLHWYSWADRYFVKKKNVDKLVFYFYPKNKYVIFGLSVQWTAILENYPMLQVSADEVWKSTLKWKLYELDDIEKKWIPSIIEILVKYYGV